ncbi:Uma2 family endonuclease [Streptomyces violaceus]|uniref:Uma2 family endonuclease n=1 Tax=Streptomyces violaceus TaxID=1936 RepID=UPI002E2E5DAE|nr:Uma2 family endonuclease [Streptomyces violaceus]
MTIAPDDAHQGASHMYRAMRDFVQSTDDTLPGKFEITKEGIVHDMMSPSGRHELTTLRLRKRLEKVMPEELVAHTGEPDVESEPEGVMRRPDIMVIAEEDMDVDGSFDARTLIAAIEVVSRSNPRNDWVGKTRDYPLLGIPIYVIFDPRTGSGAVFTDIHSTPEGPRYAVRKNFVYGEDVTIGEWTISTSGLPLYQDDGAEEAES